MERCGDRQRKCDGLEKRSFRLCVGCLPVMLQIALLLLTCGICRYMASVNMAVASTLFALTCLGFLFYVVIFVVGVSSYDRPPQPPAPGPPRSPREANEPPSSLSKGLRRIFRANRPRSHTSDPPIDLENLPPHTTHEGPSPPTPQGDPPPPISRENTPPPVPHQTIVWAEQDELNKIQIENTNDVRCVSWILKKITDPEALDTAIRRAGTIRWFDDGINARPVYDLIFPIFYSCFGSDREVYPGSRDRAYFAARAILWIHTLATRKSYEFSLPTTQYSATGFDDLQQLLEVMPKPSAEERVKGLLRLQSKFTPLHFRFVSSVLLHQPLAQTAPGYFQASMPPGVKIPLDAIINFLLMYRNFLGFPVEEEVLKIQDKSCGIFSHYPFSCLYVVH